MCWITFIFCLHVESCAVLQLWVFHCQNFPQTWLCIFILHVDQIITFSYGYKYFHIDYNILKELITLMNIIFNGGWIISIYFILLAEPPATTDVCQFPGKHLQTATVDFYLRDPQILLFDNLWLFTFGKYKTYLALFLSCVVGGRKENMVNAQYYGLLSSGYGWQNFSFSTGFIIFCMSL